MGGLSSPTVSLFDGAGARRGARARLILDLVELQQVCRTSARPWVTSEEWTLVWGRDREWNGEWETAKRAVMRLKELLEGVFGVGLELESPNGEAMRIHVGTREIAMLIEPDLRAAQEIDEAKTARREGRAPQPLEETLPPAAEIVDDYANKNASLRWLSRKHRRSPSVMRKMLVAAKQSIVGRGRRPIEHVRSPELLARALREFDAGASVSAIARLLRCARSSVRGFLERNGRG